MWSGGGGGCLGGFRNLFSESYKVSWWEQYETSWGMRVAKSDFSDGVKCRGGG